MSAQPTCVWLQDGGLIYRLQQTNFGLSNCDEIEVKQVGGSRAIAPRAARAAELIKLIEAEQPERIYGYWVSHPEYETKGEYTPIPLTDADKANGWTEIVLVARFVASEPAKPGESPAA